MCIICYISTPFQLRFLAKIIAKNYLGSPNKIILHNRISKESLNKFEYFSSSRIYQLKDFDWNFADYSVFDRQKRKHYRNTVKYLKKFANSIISDCEKDSEYSVYLSSEKDIFSQILLNTLSQEGKKQLNYISFEEGTRNYFFDRSIRTKLLKFIYPPICKLLIGFPYEYYHQIGVHKKIKKLFVRKIDYLPRKIKSIKYIEISEENSIFKNSAAEKRILFIGSPFSEDKLLSTELEFRIIKSVLSNFRDKGIIHIKPHPREILSKYHAHLNGDIKMLNKSTLIEDIDIFQYRYIINFGSSAILDIALRGFDLGSIYTYEVKSFPINFLHNIFKNTHLVKVDSNSI